MTTKIRTVSDEGISLEAMVEEHFDYLYRYAYRFIRITETAEDVVQETFLAAASSIEKFGGRSSPRTWLVGIMRHKLLDRVKARKRLEELPGDDEKLAEYFDDADHWRPEAGPLVWGAQPEQVLRQRQFFAALERCLGKVPERMRQIFLLREMEGLEREEIGLQLEITANHVGVLLHRVRILLQQCLQNSWFNGGAGEGAR